MIRRPPIFTRIDTLFLDTTLFRSYTYNFFLIVRYFEAVSREQSVLFCFFFPNGNDLASVLKTVTPNNNCTQSHRALNRSAEHTSELQSLIRNSSAVLCLNKKKNTALHNNKKSY